MSLMITEVSDDVLDDNVTLGVSDGVDIALNSDDTKTTTVTEDAVDEADDKLETDSSDLDDVQTAANAVSDEKVNTSTNEHQKKEYGEGISWTTVKIVSMDDESDDMEDTQITATFYETISESENASEFSKDVNQKGYEAEIAGSSLPILSQEDLSSEEDYEDSNEVVMEVDSYDGMFSTEADTAEVSAVEFIVDDYYDQEVTLENPIAYFEDIEDEDMFSSASGLEPYDIEDLEISGSGEILEDLSSSVEFYEDLNVNRIDEYMEDEVSGKDLFDDTEPGSSVLSTIENLFEENVNSTSDEDETSTLVNILNNFDMDLGKKGEVRHPKLISSWKDKNSSCRQLVSINIILVFILSLIHRC